MPGRTRFEIRCRRDTESGQRAGQGGHAVKALLLVFWLLAPLSAQANPPTKSRTPGAPASTRTITESAPGENAAPADDSRALKAELAALKASQAVAEKTADALREELRRLNTELLTIRQASANVLQIQNERDNLQESVIHLERELEAVKRAKLAAEEDHRQSWFLIGAGVLLGGLILGLVLPQLSWRRRSGWDSF